MLNWEGGSKPAIVTFHSCITAKVLKGIKFSNLVCQSSIVNLSHLTPPVLFVLPKVTERVQIQFLCHSKELVTPHFALEA